MSNPPNTQQHLDFVGFRKKRSTQPTPDMTGILAFACHASEGWHPVKKAFW